MSPRQTGEAGIVSISRDPFRATLNGKRGQIGISNDVALGIGLATQALKNIPVTLAGGKRHGVGMFSYCGGERQGTVGRRGIAKHTWMGYDSQETAQDKIGHAEGCVGIHRLIQPAEVFEVFVVRGVS
jgi:hypothetical protein